MRPFGLFEASELNKRNSIWANDFDATRRYYCFRLCFLCRTSLDNHYRFDEDVFPDPLLEGNTILCGHLELMLCGIRRGLGPLLR